MTEPNGVQAVPPLESQYARGARMYSLSLTIMFALIAIIMVICIILGFSLGSFWAWMLTGALSSTAWIVLSIRQVRVNELGGTEFFGAPITEVEEGPHFVPFLLCRLRKLPAQTLEDEFPGEPEDVFKGADIDFDHTSGLVRPIRITAGSHSEDDASGPLEVQMTAEVQAYVHWFIKRKFLFNFLRKVGSVAAARQRLRDTAERVLAEIAGEHTMGWIVKNTKIINDTLKQRLAELVDSWGVEIETAGIKEPDLSHEVNKKLAAIAESKAAAQSKVIDSIANATAVVNAAAAERTRLEKEGAGIGKAEQLRLAGKGKGIRDFAKAAGVCGAEALGAEVASTMFGKSDKIVLGGADGLKDIFAAGKIAAAAFESAPVAPKPEETKEEEK